MTKKPFFLTALAICALGVQGTAIGDSDFPGSAKNLSEANLIFVHANDCRFEIAEALSNAGFGIAVEREDADSVMNVTIMPQGKLMSQIPKFSGFGSKAKYTVKMTGDDGKSLFGTTGDEGSITKKEMCEDIGDEVASKLAKKTGNARFSDYLDPESF